MLAVKDNKTKHYIEIFVPKKLLCTELKCYNNSTIKTNDVCKALLINNIGINFIKTSYRCIIRMHDEFIKSLISTIVSDKKNKFIIFSSAVFFNKINRLIFLPFRLSSNSIGQITDILRITTRIRYYHFISYSSDGYLVKTKEYKSQIKFNTNNHNDSYITTVTNKISKLIEKNTIVDDIDDLIDLLGIIPHKVTGKYNSTGIKNYFKDLLITIINGKN